jgi:tetratricopeptide (TPR) repeat protein
LGLLFIGCEFIIKARLEYKTLRTALALVCVALGFVTIKRDFVWISPEALWRDAVAKRPQNMRALMDLGVALVNRNACAEASGYLGRAVAIRRDYQSLSDLAAAQSCMGDRDAALATYMDAATIQETPQLWINVATIRFNRGEVSAALDALDRAQKKDPKFPNTYVARGNLFLAVQKFSDAEQQFRFVLNDDPENVLARQGLTRAVVATQR